MAPRIPYAAAGRVAKRVPGLRRIPVVKLLVLGEIALLAREHVCRLRPEERRRLLDLVRKGRGRKRNLTTAEWDELSALVARAEPRRFTALAANKLSPMPLPKRLVDAVGGPAAADAMVNGRSVPGRSALGDRIAGRR
jgi:hypothetical protein